MEMFVIPYQERDLFYKAVESLWSESESFRALGIPISVIFTYMMNIAQL